LRNLRIHLENAADKLTHSGGEVNERLADARGRYEKAKEIRQRNGQEEPDEQDDEDLHALADAETKVEAITARMEEKTRAVVDSNYRLEGLTEAMGNIVKEEGEAITAALGVRQTRAQRLRQRENEDGDEDPADGDYEDAQERETRERNRQNPPSGRLVAALADQTGKWNDLSLTERYVFCLPLCCAQN
jgi:hypothetical protein